MHLNLDSSAGNSYEKRLKYVEGQISYNVACFGTKDKFDKILHELDKVNK